VCPACGGPLASWCEGRSSEPELADVRYALPSAGDLAVAVAALALAPVAVMAELPAGLAGRGGTIAVLARRL
jgi:hypothetical protein